MNKLLLVIFALCLGSYSLNAQSSFEKNWTKIRSNQLTNGTERYALPSKFELFQLNISSIKTYLSNSPMEFTNMGRKSNVILEIPFPNGTVHSFKMVETVMMEPGLAQKFPSFKTYSGQGVDHPTDIIKVSFTDLGFQAMVLSPEGSVFIDPYNQFNTRDYIVYYSNDFKAYNSFICETEKDIGKNNLITANHSALRSNGAQLRTYRLALACTGEYAATKGGTTSGAMSGMVASMLRVNGIYETEASIRMVMIANNNLLIYLNGATDPYTNTNGSTMLTENQNNINAVIGTANYDIGHVFSTGGGGVAQLNGPCGTSKAKGVTGNSSPVGDSFDVDYVAHEMGHQFGANHTFNSVLGSCGGGNRAASAAYEPGSGVTIMAYAGICSTDDLAPHSIAYFHTWSFDEIYNFSVLGTGNGCAVQSATGNNPPTASIGATANFIIPYKTPFTITGVGSDPDGDAITYSWEEFDKTATGGAWNAPTLDAPLFRPFSPVTSPSRTFPILSDILNNVTTIGELLPTYARTLKFRLTVRDNRSGGGGVTHNDDTLKVQVINTSTPFKVTVQNTAVIWNSGSSQTVTWDVSSSNISPINCANVKISFSTDGGLTFPNVVAASTPNDGTELITVPAILTTQARIKIEAVGNIFFDINDVNFAIQASSPVLTTLNTNTISTTNLCVGQTLNVNYTGDGPANAGNIFTAQLSNSAGSFTSPVSIGTLTSVASSGTISCTIPTGTGTGYRIRIVSSNPVVIGSDNGVNLTKLNSVGSAGNITGIASVCQGQTSVVYSISAITNATTYTWSLPTGASISAGNNTTSITVTYSAVAVSGNVSVIPSNACFTGNSSPLFAVTVLVLPSAAGVISGPTSSCKNSVGNIYSVSAITNATGYNWTLPGGASITSGINTNTITVSFGTTSGNITVAGTNSCGSGTVSTLALNLLNSPSPAVVSAGSTTTICTTGSVSLSYTPAASSYNQWRKNGVDIFGANAATLSVNQSGAYDVASYLPLTFSNTTVASIPDNSCTGVSSTINVSGYTSTIASAKIYISINITHTYDADLQLYLESPGGQRLGLANAIGSSGDNFTNTVFADSGSAQIPATGSPYTGLYKPWTTLFTVTGCTPATTILTFAAINSGSINPNGDWKLFAYDRAAVDVGTINNWTITFPAAPALCPAISNAINVNASSPAVITSYTPSTASVGTSIAINGSGFLTTTAVSFNSINAPLFSIVNDNQINATVPVGATTGVIRVTTVCGIATGPSFTVSNNVTLQLHVFIQGFYLGSGQMNSIVAAGQTDTITVELHAATSPYGLVYSAKEVLSISGNAAIPFPAAASGNNYYIVVHHRNSIETWSKNIVLFSGTTLYNFTN